MSPYTAVTSAADEIPSGLTHPAAARFWFAVLATGAGTGVGAVLLTTLLDWVQRLAWGSPTNLLVGAQAAGRWRHVLVLAAAGVLTGLGQLALRRLTTGNGIDTTEAIAFQAGRMPPARTLGSAALSVIVVGMGASLGREGAPKQAGAVLANGICDRKRLSDEQRRLLVACGAGAGLSAAYGVPVGGALFALEVMRGKLALRYVLPALAASIIAALVSWTVLPSAPTYRLPDATASMSIVAWSLLIGPIAGLASVAYVRLVRWADRVRPSGTWRVLTPAVALAAVGVVSIQFPQLLGNGKELSQLTFSGELGAVAAMELLVLKPAATLACLGSGTPGGLFTPSLTAGALLGSVLGRPWAALLPGDPSGLFAVVGAGAMLAATTQGPISAAVLVIELTGRDRSLIAPLLIAIAGATLVARTLELRSIYEARLSDAQVAERHQV